MVSTSKNPGVYAYPNPFTDEVTFRFTAPQSGIGKIELYDMSGGQVKSKNLGNVQAGVTRSVSHKIPVSNRIPLIYKLTVGGKTGNGTLITRANEP